MVMDRENKELRRVVNSQTFCRDFVYLIEGKSTVAIYFLLVEIPQNFAFFSSSQAHKISSTTKVEVNVYCESLRLSASSWGRKR